MDLHTSGHRLGVVCAPHHAATEADRAVLAEGGNALEAMVAGPDLHRLIAPASWRLPSLDHLVGAGEQGRWNVEAERSCGRQINDEFERN
jgi:hypothetical protein